MFERTAKWLVLGAACTALLGAPAAQASGGTGGGGTGGGGSTTTGTGVDVGVSNTNQGGGSAVGPCGTLSPTQTYQIVVYTTRTGIGFNGTITNCASGGGRVTYDVSVVDTNPNVACQVQVPHYTSLQGIQPGSSAFWSASSTLIPCPGTNHTFAVTLTSGTTVLATQTVSAFQ